MRDSIKPISVFFVLMIGILSSCLLFEKPRGISIVWENEKAVALTIPMSLVKETNDKQLQVRLVKEGQRTAVLGTFSKEKDEYVFEPIIPLTFTLRYEIMEGEVLIGEIEIPPSEGERPRLLAAYPSQDTVPENLLKVHLHFSRPMAEARSMSYLTLLKNFRDTVHGTFLDLQPELWNEEGTELTLWLDPGRIKLDLIPNKEMGNPLEKGVRYSLKLSSQWRSKDGIPINEINAMEFFVTARDDKSPDPAEWKIRIPKSGTYDPLDVDFGEALDHLLLQNAINLTDTDKKRIPGKIQITNEEHLFQFLPDNPWRKGKFILRVEGRLEDLAGNNLNRLFEEDLLKPNKKNQVKEMFEMRFELGE